MHCGSTDPRSHCNVCNRVIDDYFKVDLAVVRQMVQQDLPELRDQMLAWNPVRRENVRFLSGS